MNLTKSNTSTNVKNYISIALGCLAAQGPLMLVVSQYLSFVYTEYIGVSAAAVGLVLSIGALVDGISDFCCGLVMDNFRTRWGKARHWFLFMAVPLAMTGGFLFACPTGLSTTSKLIYLFILYNLYCTAITFIRLPNSTMVALIGNEDSVHKMGGLMVAFMATMGATVTGWVLNPLVNLFGGQSQRGYLGALVTISIVSGIFCLIMFFISKERATEEYMAKEAQQKTVEKPSIRLQLKSIFTNKYWLLQIGANTSSDLAFGFMMGTMAYFCQYSLNNPKAIVGIMTAQGIPMLVGVLVGGALQAKLEARNVNIFGWIICVIGAGLMFGFLSPSLGYTMLIVGISIKAFGQGVSNPSTLVFSSRISTYGYWKNGIHSEGLAFAGKDVMKKIMSALSSALLGVILTATGYKGGYCPPAAITALNSMYVYIPLICSIISLVLFCFFDLTDKKVKEMEADILAREAQQ